MFVIISPFKKSFDDIWLTYQIPENLEKYIQTWVVVDIPLQNQVVSWIVLEIIEKNFVDWYELKDIISIKYETKILYDYQINMIKWISKYYFSRIHSSLNLYLPNIIRKKIESIKLDLENIRNYKYSFNHNKNLSNSQNEAFKEILNSEKNIVFYWVTWSWKTEIYIKLIKKYMDLWFQTLLLLPEIILNNQIFERLKEVFWNDILIINSSITESQKYQARKDIYQNKAKIVVWTRSSLFYPYSNLWLVIVDEEHDASYKSEKTPKLDIREVLEQMKNYLDFKLIFASGTPSIKTMYKWLKKQYKIVNLLEEFKK